MPSLSELATTRSVVSVACTASEDRSTRSPATTSEGPANTLFGGGVAVEFTSVGAVPDVPVAEGLAALVAESFALAAAPGAARWRGVATGDSRQAAANRQSDASVRRDLLCGGGANVTLIERVLTRVVSAQCVREFGAQDAVASLDFICALLAGSYQITTRVSTAANGEERNNSEGASKER